MKKLIILASALVLTASAVTAAYVHSQKFSDLFEANVAALKEMSMGNMFVVMKQ